jgi:pimeloyl-ACP methyl ester carboxylesterase
MVSGLVILGMVLLVAGLVLGATMVALMARSLLRPPRMSDGKAAWFLKRLSPGDLGLPFEELSFDVRGEHTGRALRISGWWIPTDGGDAHRRASDRCVVLLHGYADAKVGAIAWAPLWHGLGFNILAIDLRAHGDSGGEESTGGYFERHDVEQVIGQLRAERPREAAHVVLFGISLGAGVAAAVAALADEPRDDRGDIRGVDPRDRPDTAPVVSALVMESPFADFAAAAAAHMDALGLPGGPFPPAALWLAERWSGARFDQVRPVDLVAKARCPVLIIAPTNDPFRSDADTAAMEVALAARPAGAGIGQVWRVEGADHLTAAHADPAEYRRVLESFLDQALGGSQPAAGAPLPAHSSPESAKLAHKA